MQANLTNTKPGELFLPFLYFFGRIILFLGLFPDSLYGLGDLKTYFSVAALKGWPFLDYWVEYPPIFPWINAAIYRLAGANQDVYNFILFLLLSAVGAAGIWIFLRLARHLYGENEGFLRTLIYFAVLSILPYTWWYFDSIPVFFTLLGLYWIIREKHVRAGVAIGLGILAKWFPIFLLVSLWRHRSPKKALLTASVALGLTAFVFGILYIGSPKMTTASLVSQPGRSSWETVWALIDGNYSTGLYIHLEDRLDPSLAGIVGQTGNPARIPIYLTLAVFGGLGLWMLWKTRSHSDLSMISLVGITWGIFFLWSPGWSPQWILYLIPLILLTLPYKRVLAWVITLVAITLLEWPIILSHLVTAGLWLVVPVRVMMLVGLVVQWFTQTRMPVKDVVVPSET